MSLSNVTCFFIVNAQLLNGAGVELKILQLRRCKPCYIEGEYIAGYIMTSTTCYCHNAWKNPIMYVHQYMSLMKKRIPVVQLDCGYLIELSTLKDIPIIILLYICRYTSPQTITYLREREVVSQKYCTLLRDMPQRWWSKNQVWFFPSFNE